ncbi:hypothetical protein [Acidaminobacterium chupaoyuni]
MTEGLIWLAMGIWNILIYRLGLRDGSNLARGKTLAAGKNSAANAATERMHAIMENIERYNGTARNQKEVK